MNPFHWNGPEFLLFYAVFGAILLFIQYRWTRDDAERVPSDLNKMASDPYRIAYLRGGANEAIKVVTLSLIDRGLLKSERNKVQTRDKAALEAVQRPIEKEVLRRYFAKQTIYYYPSLFFRSSCDAYHHELSQLGLLVSPEKKRWRWMIALIVTGLLLVTSWIKIDIALAQDKHNIEFLCMLTALFIGLSLWSAKAYRSRAGNVLLYDLQTFFARLKLNAMAITPGGKTNEALLLMAIFGTQYLPHAQFPFATLLYPNGDGGNSGGGGDGGGSCGSGCGGCGS